LAPAAPAPSPRLEIGRLAGGSRSRQVLMPLQPSEDSTMERMQLLFSGSGAFALSFLVSLALLALFVTLYSVMTAHREMTMIRRGNRAAALSLGGAIVGFVIPVAKAVAQSADLTDLVVWAAIAFVAQVLAYLVTATLVPHLRRTIEDDHVASGILLASLAVSIGMLNAAAMTG
jgi:putative membrane protein